MPADRCGPGDDDYPDYWDDDGDIEEDEDWDDCGMMPDGQCTQAGTEWCDWGCPRSRAEFRAALAKHDRKKKGTAP